MLKALQAHADWATVFLRVGVGLVFFIHGIGKLLNVGPWAAGISGTAGFLESMGVPLALFFAVVVALVETFGGLLVFVGLFTRVSALLLAINILVAVVLVHVGNGFSNANGGYEFPLLLLLASVSLLFSGPGKKLVLEKVLLRG